MALPQSADPRPETPVEDYLEQQQVALDDEPDEPSVRALPDEAEEADVLEQSREVPPEDEYDIEY